MKDRSPDTSDTKQSKPAVTRRRFLQTTAGLAATLPLSSHLASAAIPPQTKLRELTYGQVRLTGGPLLQQFQQTQGVLANLDNDRLLKVFRQRAHQPAPGEDMGGWYDNDGFSLPKNPDGTTNFSQANFHGYIPGHSFGQHLSALARGYAATEDPALKNKISQLVTEYGKTLDAKASFFEGYRLPAYTYDKLAIGLLDAYRYAGDKQALELHTKLTHGVQAYLPAKALNREEMGARPHPDESWTWDESYTLPENLYLAYTATGDPFYRRMAARYLEDDTWFSPLAKNQNVLAGKHAYSHVNSISSAMQAYLVDASEQHYDAARNFYAFLEEQTFSTGGWGPAETLLEAGKGKLGESLKKTDASFETPCGVYGQFKLTRYMMRVTGDSKFGDDMERVLYNGALGVKPLEASGRAFYYSNYQPGAHKHYYQQEWPCCAGTLPQLAADYHISIYLERNQGLAVNLFVPSRVQWKANGIACSLDQTTQYPLANTTTLRFSSTKPVQQTLAVRIPQWAGPASVLKLNGESLPVVRPGTFAEVERVWKPGDTLELALDFTTRLKPVDDQHPDLVSLMHGPLVLFAVGEQEPVIHRKDLLASRQTAPGEWETRSSEGKPVRLLPFFTLEDEPYSTYLRILS